MSKEKANIDVYLDSNKHFVPGNISQFQGGGPLEGLCPLCHPKEDTPIDIYEGDPVGLYESFDGGAPATVTFDNGIVLPICQDCEYDIQAFDSYFTANNINEEGLRKRLLNYRNFGKLPEEYSARPELIPSCCVFCSTKIHANDKSMSIRVPVSQSSWCDFVRACEGCSEVLQYQEGNHDFEDVCIRCDEPYPITQGEYSIREQQESLKEHICQNCYLSLEPLKHPDLYRDKAGLKDRFPMYHCTSCQEHKVFDRTRYTEPVNPKERFICRECHQTVRYKARLDDEGRYLIVVEKEENSNLFYYYFLCTETEGEDTVIGYSKHTYYSPEDAMFNGTTDWFRNFKKSHMYTNIEK